MSVMSSVAALIECCLLRCKLLGLGVQRAYDPVQSTFVMTKQFQVPKIESLESQPRSPRRGWNPNLCLEYYKARFHMGKESERVNAEPLGLHSEGGNGMGGGWLS